MQTTLLKGGYDYPQITRNIIKVYPQLGVKMFELFVGIALGWLAFTPDGKKTANAIAKKSVDEVKRTLKETGLLEDEPKSE